MSNFKTKYPAFSALMLLVAALSQDFASGSLSIIQKFTNLVNVIPQVVAFVPLAGMIATELASLKQSPADIEAGAEVLIADLAFSSSRAQSVIAAALPVAEGVAGLVAPFENLFVVIKG